ILSTSRSSIHLSGDIRDLHSFPTRRSSDLKTVEMELDKRSFAWYNTQIHDWYAASGEYEILAAASSRDIRLKKTVYVESTSELPMHIHMNTTIGELLENPKTKAVVEGMTDSRSEEHTSELQSRFDLVCLLLVEK